MIKLISLVKDFFRKPKRKGLIYSDPVYEFFDGAELKSVVKNTNWEVCQDDGFFHLRDSKGRDFNVSISTILQCLQIAEKKYWVPEIDEKFWRLVNGRYKLISDNKISKCNN
ncbi:hypothetical protein [Mucispirillum schaedleri]|mgnify:FL=1|jgi:hypothetical protein|uniref:Uncharacterized protein n=1 Tax=Mucispirillum schaedleri ASF457 TaxID=1379858 RepID=V2Q9E9_9BACT|nr:hypothetical protein [Mucispirillum schaedleri]MCX4361054.1 hypothetical protein [Mucispirillum schaedleri]USF23012.1 hypothetical protein N508_000065 [Mucispirillum schaedleri ASF457]SIW07915.1 conserved hypothetical protein [Mucispirillum schaedleri ASF457]